MNMLACMKLIKTIDIKYATIYIPYIVNVNRQCICCVIQNLKWPSQPQPTDILNILT